MIYFFHFVLIEVGVTEHNPDDNKTFYETQREQIKSLDNQKKTSIGIWFQSS